MYRKYLRCLHDSNWKIFSIVKKSRIKGTTEKLIGQMEKRIVFR